jgi:hypothetical protein
MFKSKVQMYGLSHEITDLREVEIELPDKAGMNEVLAAMKKAIPPLEGTVIVPGTTSLMDLYKFNINGRFYFEGMDFQLHPGDRIALLIPAMGG